MLRFEPETDFGKWLAATGKTCDETAHILGVCRSYVWMLARGKAVPSARMMAKIQAYTFGQVPAGSWMMTARKTSPRR